MKTEDMESRDMKITASLIVKNEGANIKSCLESIRPHVDKICVIDTGSTDNTVELAKAYAGRVEVFTECNDAEGRIKDFAAARNKALSLVDPDSWMFWCDGDDIVSGAEHLRGLVANHPQGQPAMILFPYEYAYDGAGNVTTLHWRERLVWPASEFAWHMPVHEVLMPKPSIAPHCAKIVVDAVRVKHRRAGKEHDADRNLRILRPWVAGEGKGDLRGLFYYGLELRKSGDIEGAREALTEYATKSGWADEKCIAQLELASLELNAGNIEECIKWGLQAQVTKSWPDPYYVVGYALHNLAVATQDLEQKFYNYRRACFFLQRGTELGVMGGGETVLFSNPTELYEAQKVLCACFATIGEFEKAAASCALGLKGFPNDPGLLDYQREFSNRRDEGKVMALISEMVGRGGLTEESALVIAKALKGEFHVKRIRPEMKEPEPGLVACQWESADQTEMPLAKPGLRIVFYTGPAYEDWTPEKVDNEGMGGSETMCVELARRLAKIGHAVRVYGQPDKEGDYDGVQYLHHDRWGSVSGDVLVCSRIPSAVDSGSFGLRLLWVHDVHCGEELTRERILRFDRVLALSHWHKQFLCETYPMLDPERVVVTRNGVELERFRDPPERNPKRLIYSSSPDRGLRLALELWPRIREQVPDAEFHVYYGFDNWEKSAARWAGHPELCREALESVKAGLQQPGVFYHGRVNPRELARAFLESGVWFYPTWFSETSSITAMEAQIAGCHVVTSSLAALAETVFSGARFDLEGEGRGTLYGSPEHRDWCVRNVVDMIGLGPDLFEARVRDGVNETARNRFDLETLAFGWSELLYRWRSEVSDDPMPAYRPWRATA